MKSKNRILITLMAMAMLYMAMTLQVFAADAYLQLSDTVDASGTGYVWDSETNTLTITEDGLTIEGTTAWTPGIGLPADSTIIVNGELTIATYYWSIYCTGDLIIVANADTNITSSSYEAIKVVSGEVNITVPSGVTMNIDGYDAINTYSYTEGLSYVTISVDGELNLNSSNSGSVGIRSQETVTLTGTGSIYIYGLSTPIYAGGSTEDLYPVYLGVDSSDSLTITFGSIVSSTYSSTFKIADDTSINGLISYTDEEIVYGSYTATASLSLSGNTGNSLTFSEGSLVTINENVYIDLTSYASVDYTYANIINNGVLVLSDDAPDISELNITGSGTIEVIGDDGLTYCYDNDGTLSHVEGEPVLGDTEVTTSSFYKWTKDTDDIYTLELFSGVDYKEISFCIEVESAIIYLTDDVTVESIELDWDYGTNLSVSGEFTLNCLDEISGSGILTIEEGATLVSPSIELIGYRPGENEVRVLSLLVVSGTLKSNDLSIGDFEVTNTGAVYLSSEEESPFTSYSSVGTVPTATLGDQIKIISPEGAYYSVTGTGAIWDAYNGHFYTSDDELVLELYIGAKPYYDITVTVIGEGSVSPDGDTVSVMEGFDKEFTFTPADGYEISEVIINGESWGAITSYTFEEVVEDCTLEVEFILSAGDDEGGSNDGDDEDGSGSLDDEDGSGSLDDEDDSDNSDDDDESDLPTTGDSANIALYMVAMMLGICGLVVVGFKKSQDK